MLLLQLIPASIQFRGAADHQQEALLSGGKLGNIIAWMGSSNMFLHGTKAFFLGHIIIQLRAIVYGSL